MVALRNVGIMAHIDAGKTTTTERILFYTGVKTKMGEVDEGSATMDWMEQEKERGITITAASTTCFWRDHQINIIDTPGHIDFTIEVQRSLRILDGAIAIFSAVEGVEPQTETVWRQADRYSVPRIGFVNKMDRPGADFDRCLRMIEEILKAKPLPLQIPLKNGEEFVGFIDVLREKAVIYDRDRFGISYSLVEVPEEQKSNLSFTRERIFEMLSEIDDEILSLYVNEEKIDEAIIKKVIRKGTLKGQFLPVLCGSAFKNKGIQFLLDAIVDFLPSPLDVAPYKYETKEGEKGFLYGKKDEPLAGLVFKIMNDPFIGKLSYVRIYSGVLKVGDSVVVSATGNLERVGRIYRMHANRREEIDHVEAGDICAIFGLKEIKTGDTIAHPNFPVLFETIEVPKPVLSCAIFPKKKEDLKKMWFVFNKYVAEDPSLNVRLNQETDEIILSGMGELHLEIVMDRAKREHNLEMFSSPPQVAYRETITKNAKGVGKYIRQSGGRGQYGHVVLEIRPNDMVDFLFKNKITGGVIPKEFIPSIEKGIKETLEKGILLGYPVINIEIDLIDGSFHEVDSSELAFKIASSLALKDAFFRANPILLEPIMKVDINVPQENMGVVVAHLASRRGRIISLTERDGIKYIVAHVPLEGMFGYTTELRSLSQGRGYFTMEFSHYAPIPRDIFEKIKGKTLSEESYG